MRNAAHRALSIFGQQTVVCHAKIGGQPHTLEARKTHTGWILVDLCAFANAEPTAAALKALQPWLVARNVSRSTRTRTIAVEHHAQVEVSH